MFQPSREEARRFFCDAWRKYRDGRPLSGLEATAVQVISLHPEYHALLEEGERAIEREWMPEGGETNPFLHLSLHLAIEEQLSIDQPRGIREQYQHILEKASSEHEAKHRVLECLAETVWHAQRHGTPPDERIYLECIGKKIGIEN